MSCDDYARHIAQKYRLAISIAILNTKPENLSIDEYIDQINGKINEKNEDDDNISISAYSDDFNINSSDDANVHQSYMNQNRLSHDGEYTPNFNRNKDYTNQIDEMFDQTEVNDEQDQSYIETRVNDNAVPVNDRKTQDNDNRTQLYIEATQDFLETRVNDIKARVNDGKTQDNGNRTQLYIEETQGYIETQVNDDEGQVNDRKTQDNDNRTQLYVEKTQGYFETQVKFNTERDLSINILHDFEEASVNDVNKERREEMREVIKVLKGVEDITTDMDIDEIQRVVCDGLQNKPFDPNDMDLTQCYNENDRTLTKTDVLSNADRECNLIYNKNNFERRQRDTPVPIKQFDEDTRTIVNSAYTLEDNNIEIKKGIRKRMNNNAKNNLSNAKIMKNINNEENNTKHSADIATERNGYTVKDSHMNFAINNSLQDNRHKDQALTNIGTDLQETLYTGTENTQFNTHFSPSQMNDVVLDNQFIYGSKNITKENCNAKEITKDVQKNVLSNSQDELNGKTLNFIATDKNLTEHHTAFLSDAFNKNEFPIKTAQALKNVIENDTVFPDKETHQQNIEKDTFSQNMHLNDITFKPNATDDLDEDSLKGCTILNKATDSGKNDNLEADLTDKEKIPFKIIEETNRIKIYLRRRETQHSSGCRSSQGTQPQSVWIGQSANSVFNYLSSCALVTATQELTEQISEVLGQLIDRLHDEETYPPFLEDLLNTVDKFLKLVYEEENYAFDVLLKKDEQIQRILLLNKSTHVQKFTIEKISDILQKLLDEISSDDTLYEIRNINRIENLSYIFQLLQLILARYSINSSQISTQSSQDEKCLRKKDITDLWRRKWIANIKDSSIEGSSENRCVLRECSGILNKIVVILMDGYSLIAFAALNCFNMMQS